ncbi:MAG: hypothetical protein FJY75_10075, partial [Candidatus Eisenbacteria bacterium]|nr:hypothetical protein [Candidatus Eisenbacteria bacterium]
MLPLRPLTPITALAGTLALLLLAPAGALPAGAAAPLPDWSALRPALYDLEAHLPGDPEPRSGIGFAVQGVDGIVTCLQFVQGAARVTARPVHGSPIEITEYVVHDPAADLILLQAPAGPTRLARGTFRLLALGQTVFAMLPPPAPQAAQPVQYFATFLASGAGELLGVAGGAPTGAVLVDSLGKVLGIVHVLSDGMTTASAAVPIERLFAMLASPETGGPLSALAGGRAP